LPLAILALPSGYNSYRAWLPAILSAPRAIFSRPWPQVLVLEVGVARPGDMKYLLSIIRPQIAVITNITQRYLESFSDMNELAAEYLYLAKKIKDNGLVVLNLDNSRLIEIAKSVKAPRQTYGIENKQADWRAEIIEKNNLGQKIKVIHQGKEKEFSLKRPGKHHVYALLAGLIVEKEIKKT